MKKAERPEPDGERRTRTWISLEADIPVIEPCFRPLNGQHKDRLKLPHGKLEISCRVQGRLADMEIHIPYETVAEIRLGTRTAYLEGGICQQGTFRLGTGNYTVRCRLGEEENIAF